MIEDIAPRLLEEIKAKYGELSKQSATLKDIKKKIKSGKATYADMAKYADELGSILAAAYDAALTPDALPDGKMYYNIAKRTVEPTMKSTGRKVATACETTQTALNKKAKIGIKAQKVQVSQDRIDGIINKVSSADKFKDVSWVLQEPVKTFSRSIVDDSIRANAEFQYSAGMTPKIVRTVTGKCCDWCQEVAGTYKYPDVPKDVYRRHSRCRCVVEYLPGNGKRQNVHTKKWADETSQEVLEKRKTFGLENSGGNGRINAKSSVRKQDVHYVGKIDKKIYGCVTNDIVTNDIIITDRQIKHIKARHPSDFERFNGYLSEITSNPDYIIKSNKPNTALIMKKVSSVGEVFKMVVRLATSADDIGHKNSIITFMKIDQKEWERILRNKQILYKRK